MRANKYLFAIEQLIILMTPKIPLNMHTLIVCDESEAHGNTALYYCHLLGMWMSFVSRSRHVNKNEWQAISVRRLKWTNNEPCTVHGVCNIFTDIKTCVLVRSTLSRHRRLPAKWIFSQTQQRARSRAVCFWIVLSQMRTVHTWIFISVWIPRGL